MLEFSSFFQISFVIEIIGLSILFIYIGNFWKGDEEGRIPSDFMGLKRTKYSLLIVVAFLVSLPWWFTECVIILDNTWYRRAFAAFSYSTLIKAPVFEELYFRGILFHYLKKRQNNSSTARPIMISSAAFALIHLPLLFVDLSAFTALVILGALMFGAILCYIQNHTRNILYPILLHFLVNLVFIFSNAEPFISNPGCI